MPRHAALIAEGEALRSQVLGRKAAAPTASVAS